RRLHQLFPQGRRQRNPQTPWPARTQRRRVPQTHQGKNEPPGNGLHLHEPRHQRRLLGRRKETQRSLPDGRRQPPPRAPRRNRLRPRHRRPQNRGQRRHQKPSVRQKQAHPPRHPLPTTPQLHHPRQGPRDDGRPHRQKRRQGTRPRTRISRL